MYTENDLVRIAKRENNKKRNYLVVNRLQGKHIPVRPQEALLMFHQLASMLREAYKNERLLLIGFAETATAIGAAVAIEAGTQYVQTTRESIPGAEYLYFTEDHSHATEQKLVKDGLEQAISETDRIVFIEDEVTTGDTILHIVHLLMQAYEVKRPFSVASLLNGMDGHAMQIYREKGIRLHYLVKTDHKPYPAIADSFILDGTYQQCHITDSACQANRTQQTGLMQEIGIDRWMDARRTVCPQQYKQACEYLWHTLKEKLKPNLAQTFSGRVLVLGTEEFMFPALFVADKIGQAGANVMFHATTRSPIAVSRAKDYPLHARYELRSMYDKDRITYVYDIDTYDSILVMTDSQSRDPEGICSLLHVLKTKSKKIYLIRWHE